MSTQNVRAWWGALSPERRKTLVGVGCLGVLLLIIYLFMSASPRKAQTGASDAQADVNLLTGSDTHTLGLETLGAELRDTQRNHRTLQAEVDQMRRDMSTKRDLQQISGDLQTLTEAVHALKVETTGKPVEPLAPGASRPGPAPAPLATPVAPLPGPESPSSDPLHHGLFDSPPPSTPANGATPVSRFNRPQDTDEAVKVRVFGESEPSTSTAAPAHTDEVYLPAGSIISGVLLTGVDAPTGMQSKRDPIPALMRIKREAILPSRFQSDVRECFLIFGATGDLSTERALLRGETISCIRSDGGVIEATVDAYGLGDDGKAGVRGRLVSRNGSLVAKAALASFSDALSQIFRPLVVQPLNTSPTSTTEFQTPATGPALEAAGYAGLGGAMQRVSQYFIGLADQIVPFVEVDAARQLEAVLLKGVTLKIRSVPK